MAASLRRALPALILFVALAVLTSVVWYRVLHRQAASAAACRPPAVTALPPPSAVVVHVRNGTQQDGLAAGVGQLLQQRGFRVADIADDVGHPDTGIAELRFGPAGRAAATLLSYQFPGATLVPVEQKDASVTVAVGAKYTQLASPEAVQKALAAAHVVISSAAASPPPASRPTPGTSASRTPAPRTPAPRSSAPASSATC